jgi:hypothetical protein
MDIGKETDTYTTEPLDDPIPREEPTPTADPDPVEEPEPVSAELAHQSRPLDVSKFERQ